MTSLKVYWPTGGLFFLILFLASCGGSSGGSSGGSVASEAGGVLIAADDYVYTSLDLPCNFDSTANDTGGSAPLSVRIIADPSNGVASVEADGTITFSPDTNFVGMDSFSYEVSDGSISDTALVTVGVTDKAERLNIATDGSQANQGSAFPSVDLSHYGNYASFISSATNLVAGDVNGVSDVFVRDRLSGVTTLVSSSGVVPLSGTSISGDGSLIAYTSESGQLTVTDTITYETIGNGWGPSLSADGRYVAFHTDDALVSEDTNLTYDIYIFDRQTSTKTLVSTSTSGDIANGGSDWPIMSSDGSTIAYRSFASNLYAPDSNDAPDFFVHTLIPPETFMVSITPDGGQFASGVNNQPGISGDGRYVAFAQWDTNVGGKTYLRDTQMGSTTLIGGNSIDPDISFDGRFVVYESSREAPILGDTNSFTDIVIYDAVTGLTMLVAVGIDGNPANGNSRNPAISPDGKFVAFDSEASNLVTGDTNNARDVFIVKNPFSP